MTGKVLLTVGLVVAALAADAIEPKRESAVRMRAADGRSYLVLAHETLGDAVSRGGTAGAVQEEETGHCVPEPLEEKPPGSIACKCYEVTDCKGNESRQCKRHCRKDLCECCSI